jgi:PAS domain S-box-containing protein
MSQTMDQTRDLVPRRWKPSRTIGVALTALMVLGCAYAFWTASRTLETVFTGCLIGFLLAWAIWIGSRAEAGQNPAPKAAESEGESLRMVIDSIEDYAIIMLDLQGHIANWNRGAERLTGYTAKEIVGRHFSRLYPPEDVGAAKPARELAEASGKGRAEDEGWRVRKDGGRFYANVVISAMRDESGQLRGFAKVIRDISERHRLEQMRVHFRSLFNSLPGLYLVLTPDLEIAAASDAYLEATMTRRDEIVGRKLFEVFPDNPDDPKASGVANLHASLRRVLNKGKSDVMPIQRYDIRGPDGAFEVRYWSPINSPLLGPDESVEYIIHRIEDVTEFIQQKELSAGGESPDRMEAEIYHRSQVMQAANERLRAANAELEAFSYSVSHDLRAPLRHIDGFADLLLKHSGPSLDDKGRRYIKTISDSAKRMGALIDDLLVFSRMGRAEMQQRKVDLSALADEIIKELQVETKGRNVDWRRQGLPVVIGDPTLLRQVLVNLFSNAVKYTRPRDPAVIEIGFESSPSEYTIYVRDNGVGFDMAYVKKLFGVFQRLHRGDEFEGTGIGLANVQRIVRRHGGRAWAEGEVDEGATFYFTLPITTVPSASTEPEVKTISALSA